MPIDAGAPGEEHGRLAVGRPSRRSLRIAAAAIAGVAAIVVIAGLVSRAHDSSQLKSWTTAQSIPVVGVVKPTASAGNQPLILPGDLQADYNAPIYSRVSGYVHAWYVDIGAPVKAGQILATIDTPELDQQLIQARADLETARANMGLAATTAKRWTNLLAQDAVSKQETDEKAGDLAARTAMVNAAKANVDRLLALKSFSRIVAPFAGVVTARRTDIGALVNAGAGATTNAELFDVAKVDKLRLYVRVPQSYSARIVPGMTATLTVPEYPGRTFKATLTSTSNAVSDTSGTLLVELAVDNSDRALKSGDYAQVRFDLADRGGVGEALRIPASALLFRKSGMEAAVVDPQSRVRLRPVTVGLDLGQAVEVTSGLKLDDRVIDNPPDSIATGDLVRVVQTADGAAKDPGAAG